MGGRGHGGAIAVAGGAGEHRRRGFDRIRNKELWISLAGFVALVTAMAYRHAMWRDEVRAFSIATRSSSWIDLINNTQQDGHPVLWYAILRIGYAATHSNLVLPVASILIAVGAAFIMLRFAPFPSWIRLLAVFGAFLGYELSVVARNYGIGVLLMLLACTFFPARRERPIRLAVVLALMANTSVHAALASLILSFVWLMDILDPASRRVLLGGRSLAALGIVLAGVAVALWSANPPPDLSHAFSFSQLQPGRVWRALLTDPAHALEGSQRANIAAAAAIDWRHLGLDTGLMSRAIVDISLLSIAWALRKNRACFAAMILSLISFELFFTLVYTAGLRHEGVLAFLLISLTWIACTESASGAPARRKAIALGLAPLLLAQTAALPFIVRRVMLYPESSSRAFAAVIKETPRFSHAILTAEPDYLMEPMAYYVDNRIFMPRQGEFSYRVYFDQGARRNLHMRMSDLLDVTDSLACVHRQPVLLAIGYRKVFPDTARKARPAYTLTLFRWNSIERARLLAKPVIFSSNRATSDENYEVFEVSPSSLPRCADGSATLMR